MTLLTTEEDIHTEILGALSEIKDEGNISDHTIKPNFNPITIPLNSKGETLTISCQKVGDFYKGESRLVFEYIIPHKLLDMENKHPHSYAKEVYDSEALEMIHSVIDTVFDDVNKINFSYSNTTATTYHFREYISLTDPTIAPTQEEYEITPVLTVNIEKKYIYKKKSKSTVLKADDDVDMVIKPTEKSDDVEFDGTVNVFGTDLMVKLRNKDNIDSTIALEKDGNVYGYVSELGGDWTHLINAKGEYPDGDLY